MSQGKAKSQPAEVMNPLEERLGYKFRNSLLLAEAMTHPSISMERRDYQFDNQRLEFLGDAVVQLVITEHLFSMFPDFSEGQLTKMRTRIVSRAALKVLAADLDLGSYLMMGRGEEASGGRERASTLADAFESLVGAVYLDGGFEASREFLLQVTIDEFEKLLEDPAEFNPKGKLQEILQAIRPSPPDYSVREISSKPGSSEFFCTVSWSGLELGSGSGLSKKQAQVAAASRALEKRSWESFKTLAAPQKKKSHKKSPQTSTHV